MNEPRISVVVPNYNHARYLPTCLEALLNQPVPAHEIIVVDDASTDNSLEILNFFARKSPLIKVRPNERNLGACHSMNRGMALAEGEYVMFPSADDEVCPGLFDRIIQMLRVHPQAGICSGLCEWRCAETGLTWYMGGGMPPRPCYLSPEEMVPLGQRGRLSIAGQNAAYKKSALMQAGGWLPELRWCTDWFAAYVVGFRQGICHVPEVLSIFNLHPTSYYNAPRPAAERRQVFERTMQLIQSQPYADVAPLFRRSGVFGSFGWPGLQVVLGHRRNWGFMTVPLARQAGRRSAEELARRFFPNWLARSCLRIFVRRPAGLGTTLRSAPLETNPTRSLTS